jgi:hypothetical protein
MKLRTPPTVDQYTLFLSSSNQAETKRLRKRVKTLIDDVISPQLRRYPEAEVAIVVDMWEREAAQKAPTGGDPNDLFVQLARESAMTLVLIVDELRDGTKEELEAALDKHGVQLAVMAFAPAKATPDVKLQALDAYFDKIKDKVLYDRRRGADSDDAWYGLVRTLMAFAISALRTSDERRREMRSEVR